MRDISKMSNISLVQELGDCAFSFGQRLELSSSGVNEQIPFEEYLLRRNEIEALKKEIIERLEIKERSREN